MRTTDPGTVGIAYRVGIAPKSVSREPLPFLMGDEDRVFDTGGGPDPVGLMEVEEDEGGEVCV